MITQMVKVFNDRIGRPVRISSGLLLAFCFFLGVVALAMHHHDVSFQLKSCAICKAKTFFSGTPNKVKADLSVATATVGHCPEELYFTNSRTKTNHQTPFIASFLPNPFSNKAPPVIS